MSRLLRVSEAASLALHTTVFLAGNPGRPIPAREIATALDVSEAHLVKVLQRLAKFGLVRSFRGPKGGFILGKNGDEISLLEIYESIEGPLEANHCLFDVPTCNGNGCIFGDLLETVHQQVNEYLSETKLSAQTHIQWRVDSSVETNSQD